MVGDDHVPNFNIDVVAIDNLKHNPVLATNGGSYVQIFPNKVEVYNSITNLYHNFYEEEIFDIKVNGNSVVDCELGSFKCTCESN